MGISNFFSIISSKRQVKKYIELLTNTTPDVRAELIFYVWLTRGINLILTGNNAINLVNKSKENGMPIPSIFIYEYKQGSEVGIIDYKNNCNVKHPSYISALNIHLYTSVCASYLNKDYCSKVRSMWKLLLSDYGDLEEIKDEVSSWFESPEIIKIIENNSVNAGELIYNPKTIYPSFLK